MKVKSRYYETTYKESLFDFEDLKDDNYRE